MWSDRRRSRFSQCQCVTPSRTRRRPGDPEVRLAACKCGQRRLSGVQSSLSGRGPAQPRSPGRRRRPGTRPGGLGVTFLSLGSGWHRAACQWLSDSLARHHDALTRPGGLSECWPHQAQAPPPSPSRSGSVRDGATGSLSLRPGPGRAASLSLPVSGLAARLLSLGRRGRVGPCRDQPPLLSGWQPGLTRRPGLRRPRAGPAVSAGPSRTGRGITGICQSPAGDVGLRLGPSEGHGTRARRRAGGCRARMSDSRTRTSLRLGLSLSKLP
jgi:hypothetical protein